MIFDHIRYITKYLEGSILPSESYDFAFQHYKTIGRKSGYEPNAIFNTEWYLSQLEENGISIDSEFDEFSHYNLIGYKHCISTHPLFDPTWYLQQNQSAKEAFDYNMDPVAHFAMTGYRAGYWPHPMFDTGWFVENNAAYSSALVKADPLSFFVDNLINTTASTHKLFDSLWYKKNYMDPRDNQAPLIHFVKYGISNDYSPCRFGKYSNRNKAVEIRISDIRLGETPLVSIIIVNLNGEKHLNDLAKSLLNLTYTNFELIFVDNGSDDNSIDVITGFFPSATIVRLETNNGFARANNIGFGKAKGELIALLNNDTKVDPEWLGSLVNKIKSKSEIAAATSKIRFWEKFVEISFESEAAFKISKFVMVQDLKYQKIICKEGFDEGEMYSPFADNERHHIKLLVPVCDELKLKFSLSTPEQTITISSRYSKRIITCKSSDDLFIYKLSLSDLKYSKFVINNVGSYEPEWLKTADRGFGEFDDGQYDFDTNVDLICGCAVLIRRDALENKSLFVEEFIAYFEDSELSKRLARDGYDLAYCSHSLVYHRHSATSIEKSDNWHFLVERNKTIYEYLHSNISVRNRILGDKLLDLNHQINYFSNPQNANTASDLSKLPVLRKVYDALVNFRNGALTDQWKAPEVKRVGIFNNYWTTLGGGEAHALEFARLLKGHYLIELISEVDFDIDQVISYFGITSGNMRRRLVSKLTSQVTEDYHIFINSSYMNECISKAKKSYYIVSFPSKNPSSEFLNSYIFLPNSNYTLHWMKRYWGNDFHYELIHPSISADFFEVGERYLFNRQQEKFVLSVGRFFEQGHSKNQLIIANVFLEILEDEPCLKDWSLLMAGSVNDPAYFDKVRRLSGVHLNLHPNCSFEDLKELYAKSMLYVHASGLGCDQENEPENFEHFGMTIAEAVASGLYPIVYNAAGPAEIVDTLEFGVTYDSRNDLKNKLKNAMLEAHTVDSTKRYQAINQSISSYSETVTKSRTFNQMINEI